mgnify:CR=1 FL=1
MTRDEILRAHPLEAFLLERGATLSNGRKRANRCPAGEHSRNDTVSINLEKGLWSCHAHGTGGTIIDWLALEKGITGGEVMKELSVSQEGSKDAVKRPTVRPPLRQNPPGGSTPLATPESAPDSREVCSYDYPDENGKLLYQVVKYLPKTFRQRQPDGTGGWRWSMEGVRRVLYGLPRVLEAEEICLCEGEKDADTLTGLLIPATCNVGGAGKWLESYSESLTGKNIIIVPDNDEAGLKHADMVQAALVGKVKTLRRLTVPAPHKDISDWVKAGATVLDITAEIAMLRLIKPGDDLPLKTLAEIEPYYRQFAKESEKYTIHFGKTMPTLNRAIRGMYPGELVTFVAEPGVGKTAFLQSMARWSAPLPTLMFELELREEHLFERFMSMEAQMTGADVEHAYRIGTPVHWERERLKNLLICNESGIDPSGIEELINKSELKLGCRPVLVLVDYVGLVAAKAASRYERMSQVSEELKRIAVRTNTVVVIASQMGRPEDEGKPPTLYSPKDSGSIENSSQLMLGGWRDPEDKKIFWIRVLKGTRGGSGTDVKCTISLKTLEIYELIENKEADTNPKWRNPTFD